MAENPYVGASREMLDEVRREAESYLAAQLQSGIAADQRAFTFVSLMTAATVIVAAGAITLRLQTPIFSPLCYPAFLVTMSFIVSMICAAWSARPTSFGYVGNAPHKWLDDIASGKPIHDALAEQIAHYDAAILANIATLESNALAMKLALIACTSGLVAGAGWATKLIFF